MVSRSSHTIMINELIILIMPVATVSFMVVNFVTYDKNSIDKKLQARQFPSRTLLYDCSQNKWQLLIKFKPCPFDVSFVFMFKNIKMLW